MSCVNGTVFTSVPSPFWAGWAVWSPLYAIMPKHFNSVLLGSLYPLHPTVLPSIHWGFMTPIPWLDIWGLCPRNLSSVGYMWGLPSHLLGPLFSLIRLDEAVKYVNGLIVEGGESCKMYSQILQGQSYGFGVSLKWPKLIKILILNVPMLDEFPDSKYAWCLPMLQVISC